jgi:hypothetical protein
MRAMPLQDALAAVLQLTVAAPQTPALRSRSMNTEKTSSQN